MASTIEDFLRAENAELRRRLKEAEQAQEALGESEQQFRQVDRITGIAEDITAYKDAEEALRVGRAELAGRARQQAAVVELGARALAGGDVLALLEQAAVLVARTLEVTHCAVLEALPKQGGLLVRAGTGWKPGVVGSAGGMESGAILGGLSSGEPRVIEDLRGANPLGHPAVLRAHGLRSSVTVVIDSFRAPFGLIGAYSIQPHSFTKNDGDFLQSIAHVLALAIRRHGLERDVLDIGERERRRFGQDLHDGVCQHLTGIAMMTFVLSHKLAAQSRPEAAEAEEITRLLREATDLTREVSSGLSPVEMETGGLAAALRELAVTTQKRTGFTCCFKNGRGAAVEDRFTAGHLLRIAQEAVQNAIRHSRGTTLCLALERRRSHLVLSVEDNGDGLPPEVNRDLGLQTMHYRAALIRGSIAVTHNGKAPGTVITCSVLLCGQEG